MFAQQLCGINSIIMYSVSLLSDLLPTASLLIVVVSATNLVATIAFSPLADKLGRKACLLLSIAGMGINALLLAFAILFSVKVPSAIATLLFVTSFAVGLGPVPFILASELVGPEAVGATQSWAPAANWIGAFLVAQFFPILNSWLGKERCFRFCGFSGAVLYFCGVVDTGDEGKRDADEVWGKERRED
jgi:MFS family permease